MITVKKWIFQILLIACMLPAVFGLDFCEESALLESLPCSMVSPVMDTSNLTFTVYSINGLILQSGNMSLLNDSLYYFNYTTTESGIVTLADGSSREFYVLGGEMLEYNLVLLSFAFVFLLLLVGFLWNTLFLFAGSVASITLGLAYLTGVLPSFFVYIVSMILILVGLALVYNEHHLKEQEKSDDSMRDGWLK